MPLPGQQHTSISNPFEEPQKRMSEFTAQEIATLQSRLERQLGPEYLSSRAGPSGQKVHYIAAEKCIALANEVFGFNGWSSSIQNIQVDFLDENAQTLKISLGLSVIVRVTLRDGTFHEDIGYGHIENCKGKAAAFEKAKKEGTTDALKRALRNFGNVLGNCIYDKAYLAKVTKMKVEPTKFDETGLHRRPSYAVKKEPVESEKLEDQEAPRADRGPAAARLQPSDSFEDLMGEMDEADFCVVEEGHPDEVSLPNTVQTNTSDRSQNGHQQGNVPTMQPPSRPMARSSSTGSNISRQPQTPNQQAQRPGQFQSGNNQQSNGAPRPHPQLQQHNGHSTNQGSNNPHQQTPPQPQAHPQNGAPPSTESAGFFSARALSQLPDESLAEGQPVVPKAGQVFNPRAESPSIRKTPGIDHTKSKPVAKNGQHVAPAPPSAGASNGSSIASPNDISAGSAGLPTAPLVANGNGSGPVQQRPGPGLGQSPGPGARSNVVNPQLDQARRIGAPMAVGSPLANRGQYRPPTMKRPGGAGDGRAPLAEVSSNNTPGAQAASGPDVKRQRVA